MILKRRTRLIALSLFLTAAFLAQWWSAPATAQSADHLRVGVGASGAPAYQGASDYRLLPIPMIDARHGRLFFNLRNGLGLDVISDEAFTAGGSLTFVPGYRRRDVPDGIGRVSDSAGARLFANMNLDGFIFTLGATKAVAGGTRGVTADASMAYVVPLSDRLALAPSFGATWADSRHMNRYFGIDARESVASGLPAFHAKRGVKDVSGLVSASYLLDDRWTLAATGGVTRLLNDAADSPLNEERWQPSASFSVNYTF